MTSPKQTSLFTGEPLTFYPVDFPANHSALQENAKVQKIHAICGPKCCEQYAKFNHATLWGKTLLAYLTGTKELFSSKCILTWRMKGTKFKRLYFQLVPSMRRIAGTEFGLLLKTPCSADAYTEGMSKKEQKFGNSGTLAQEVQTGFIYQRGMLPTPTAQIVKHGHTDKYWENRIGKRQMDIAMWNAQTNGKNSQLNPRFVAEMMGFPPNWTELPFQSGETSQ